MGTPGSSPRGRQICHDRGSLSERRKGLLCRVLRRPRRALGWEEEDPGAEAPLAVGRGLGEGGTGGSPSPSWPAASPVCLERGSLGIQPDQGTDSNSPLPGGPHAGVALGITSGPREHFPNLKSGQGSTMALGLRVIVSVTPRFNPLLTTPHPQNRGEQPVRATGDLTFQKARGPLLAVGEREMGRKETQ